MKKLTYEKYKGSEGILIIDLHNGYSIIAIKTYNKEKECYIVEFRIKKNKIQKWDLIEKAENVEFKSEKKFINSDILKQVAKFLKDGFFDYYIDRYEYELECFDRGNDLYEYEKLSGDNVL